MDFRSPAPAALRLVCLAFLRCFTQKEKNRFGHSRWSVRSDGGIFLRALGPGKARAMVANNPVISRMSRPNRPRWPLSHRSSRHSYSESYRRTPL